MTITKGSRAAHERSLKAAASRRRNKTQGVRTVPVTTHVPRGGSRNVKKMTTSELTGEYTRLSNGDYNGKTWAQMTDAERDRGTNRVYRIKDELRARYAKERYGETPLEAGKRLSKEYRAEQKVKKHRASEKKQHPVRHRKDLEGAYRRLSDAYERASTPRARKAIANRRAAIAREMGRRYYNE